MPDPEVVTAARQVVGWELIELDESASTVRFLREGVSLDLGAIGKGYAIDRSLLLMEDAGIDCALIHGGTSTVFELGAPPGAEGWRVALRDPRGGEQDSLGELLLRDRALSLSGPHNQAFRSGDRLYGHGWVRGASSSSPAAIPTRTSWSPRRRRRASGSTPRVPITGVCG